MNRADLFELKATVQDVASLLEAAVTVIENVPLIKGNLLSWNQDELCGACLMGALSLVNGHQVEYGTLQISGTAAKRRWGGYSSARMMPSGKPLLRYTDAIRLLREETGWGDLQDWNDADEREHDEVLDVLYKTIVKAHQQRL